MNVRPGRKDAHGRQGFSAGLAVILLLVQPAEIQAQLGVSLGGRIQTDATFFDEDQTELNDGTEIRRARLCAVGTVGDRWTYKTQYEFAGNRSKLKDLFVSYQGFDFGQVTIGQFKQEFGLEESISSRFATFMERPMVVTAFIPDRRVAIGIRGNRDNWHYATSIFSQEESRFDRGDEGVGIGGRVTWGPMVGEARLHAGASVNWQEPGDTDTKEWRVAVRPEVHQSNVRFLDTGVIEDVNHISTVGLEGAAVLGSVSIQTEWMRQSPNRDSGDDPDFDGAYIAASWFLTGEQRPYKNGTFGRVRASGAWEVAARFSSLDLSDGDVDGGEEKNLTLAVNYYVSPYLRFMLNYVRIEADPAAALLGSIRDEPSALMMRASMDFR